MRTILTGLFLVIVSSWTASADVLYSFSQPAAAGFPAIYFSFTEPNIITSSTTLSGTSIDAPLIHGPFSDFPILSVTIDPGLDNDEPYIGRRGVGFIAIDAGDIFSENVCFDSNLSCLYTTLTPLNPQPFDHFGTYEIGNVSLTISSTVPEPRFETLVGFLFLVPALAVARLRRILFPASASC